jgi:hypothetical protein
MSVICPYCEGEAALVDSEVINVRPSRKIYLCRPCDAYVGVHKSDDSPLGTPANFPLRKQRIRVHGVFDPLWQEGVAVGYGSKRRARSVCYRWLALKLGIQVEDCHVGQFDAAMCRLALKILKDVTWQSIYEDTHLREVRQLLKGDPEGVATRLFLGVGRADTKRAILALKALITDNDKVCFIYKDGVQGTCLRFGKSVPAEYVVGCMKSWRVDKPCASVGVRYTDNPREVTCGSCLRSKALKAVI